MRVCPLWSFNYRILTRAAVVVEVGAALLGAELSSKYRTDLRYRPYGRTETVSVRTPYGRTGQTGSKS